MRHASRPRREPRDVHALRRPKPRGMRILLATCGLALATCTVGCEEPPYQLAPVAGIVLLDGKPLEGALVNTQPVARDSAVDPGPGSFGKTDPQGRFSLELVSPAEPGAVVGTHRVRITKVTLKYLPGKEDAPIVVRDPLPREATDGRLELNVPAAGSDDVRFDLATRR